MSVEQTRTVDLISLDSASGNVVLTISDHLPWDSGEHLLRLQDKINGYIAFIESGELLQQYPKAAGRKAQITVVFKYIPNDIGTQFLERVAEILDQAGITFTFKTIPNLDCEDCDIR